MSKYYEELGFLSPMELFASAIEIEQMDLPLATLISQLAVLRSKGDIHLEVEFSNMIQSWLRSRIPELDETMKQSKAGLN